MLGIPLFLGAAVFATAQSAFADKHHLYALYITVGWVCAAWIAGVLIYSFTRSGKSN